ncbi:MAG: glycerol dehydratase reactivase beta/small subunit family protein [Vibrio sp.]|uniref:glycerol dehydratase reactivase beta/small subunit family protein n=1 Tax=Vibrio sp. TaxID=678 RepID=UPI003A856579
MHSQLQEVPAILVYLQQVDNKQLHQMLWGIEEEGIPFKATEKQITDIKKEAHNAASLSPLAVGIACTHQEIVVHSRNLTPDNPLFQVSLHTLGSQGELYKQLRNLGCNAARLVKGLPFKPVNDANQ